MERLGMVGQDMAGQDMEGQDMVGDDNVGHDITGLSYWVWLSFMNIYFLLFIYPW